MSKYAPTPAFKTAAQEVRNLTTYDDAGVRLLAYSLYKQTTVGDVEGSRPLLDYERKMMFDAWTLAKGTGHREAETRYLNCSEHMLQGRSLNPENEALLGVIKEKLDKPYLSSIWS